jgi:hypothetical protein
MIEELSPATGPVGRENVPKSLIIKAAVACIIKIL